MYGTARGRVGSGAALILDEEYGRLRRACEEGQETTVSFLCVRTHETFRSGREKRTE